MKKLLVFLSALVLTGCGNRQLLDTTYTFDKAIIETGNGIIEGKVVSWKDYEDGDQVQIKLDNGYSYLVHSSNVTLIAE